MIGGAGWSFKDKTETTNAPKHKVIGKTIKYQNFANLPDVVNRTLPQYKDSILKLVLGDGTCGLKCLAVHLGLDESEGPNLSKEFNNHLSKNREVVSRFISFPKTITKSRGKMSETYEDTYEDRNRFFDFLLTDEATYMWRESEDMIAMATYFNIPIEVIKIVKPGNVELPVITYHPDGDYEQKSTVSVQTHGRFF